MDKDLKIAGYCRISVDEELDKDNTSIENQKSLITDYVTRTFPKAQLDFYADRDRSGYTWLTNEEQEQYDCAELTHLLLKDTAPKKCKVIFFLSGKGDLCKDTEDLLISNLGCA